MRRVLVIEDNGNCYPTAKQTSPMMRPETHPVSGPSSRFPVARGLRLSASDCPLCVQILVNSHPLNPPVRNFP